MGFEDLPEWERLLAAERHLQSLVPGAVLVGGTAAALHAGHRKSLDGDHVLEDLRPRLDEVLAALEAAAPVALGSFDELYPQAGGASAFSELAERLAAAAPSDGPDVDLRSYKGLVPPWNDWAHLAARGRHWAAVLARGHLSGGRP